jgi:hypothetical protein
VPTGNARSQKVPVYGTKWDLAVSMPLD